MCLFLYVLLLTVCQLANASQWVGLNYDFTPSPSGQHLIFVTENRVDKTHDYTLTILTDRSCVYSLTPHIEEVVESPSGNIIVYTARDFYHGVALCVYLPELDVSFGLDYCPPSATFKHFQFSSDEEFLRYQEQSVRGNGPFSLGHQKWTTIRIPMPKRVQQIGSDSHPGVASDSINWLAAKAPSHIPTFLTQRLPHIQRNMELQWGPDSNCLYLLDEKGIWRVDIIRPFISRWTLVVENPAIRRFQVSPQGTHILYEVRTGGDQEEGIIYLMDLEKMVPVEVDKGWSATFYGNSIFYGNLSGYYEAFLDGNKRTVRLVNFYAQ